MSTRGVTLVLALATLFGGCGSSIEVIGLTQTEFLYLGEDVIELMTIVFQASETGLLGDLVDPGDVVDPARPENGFTVLYDLPLEDRPGLGFGSGQGSVRILEDGVVNQDPLGFSFATTFADEVEIRYGLYYRGQAVLTARETLVDLTVTVIATRTPTGFDLVDYFVVGDVDLGTTLCSIDCDFQSPGLPRDGVEPGIGGGGGWIDDPDVFDVLNMHLDWSDLESFLASGPVGCCGASFADRFFYTEVILP